METPIMRRIHYTHLDVFTAEPFGGNQLAVFFDADALDASEMQAIAREMKFSESTFILAPSDPAHALCRVRIFTPGAELPFAGHPVIGTTVALARAGRIAPARLAATLELGIGPLAVEAVYEGGEARSAWMAQPLPAFTAWGGDRGALLAALGLDGDTLRPDLPIERGSAGVPFVYVPLRDLVALARARPGKELRAALAAAVAEEDHRTGVYLFVPPGPDGAQTHARARMFAPGMGIVEDAATGAAAGPLGVYLARHASLPAAGVEHASVTIAQGVEMGRRSMISVELESREGHVTAVRVGGAAVVVAEGEFMLADNDTMSAGAEGGENL
jgi:trans-2,3-dihydro-3-hydroxyanthranilate isomerase